MCVAVNAPAGTRPAAEVFNWVCPEGHAESDDEPRPRRLFCRACDHRGLNPWYEEDEVRALGRKVSAPAGEVAHA